MSSIPYDLSKIKAFIFDMDGVISATVSPVDINGLPMRTVNVKDGYAMQYAIKQGFPIAIISGGESEAMTMRFQNLGIKHIYMKIKNKIEYLAKFEAETGIDRSEMIYVGDDVPDMEIMEAVALPCAPRDAVAEVRGIAKYISNRDGGYGVVRDVIEQTLKSHGKWSTGEGFGW